MLTGLAFGLLIGIIYFVWESFAKPPLSARASSNIFGTADIGEDPIDIQWCRNCKHHRKIAEYEDIPNGLYSAKSMPSQEMLPCKIVLKTLDVWKTFYAMDPKVDRTLFPNGCSLFERQPQKQPELK